MSIHKPAKARQAEILQTTLALACEFGPDRGTTGMIATALGMTLPAIYKLTRAGVIFGRLLQMTCANRLQAGMAEFRRLLEPKDGATPIFGVLQSQVLRLLISSDVDLVQSEGSRLFELQLALFADDGVNL